ncbi:MAG: alanine--glyoxylate aminotransferase family protein [Gemmatimonadetes bacterium]|nr:alanine--glyoxylate aminotransferase family protein [Gemmatimonadota bacterium]
MEMKTAEAPKSTTAKSGKVWGKFFLPGPTEVLPEVLEAQLKPMIGHRGVGIKTLIERLQVGLQDVFRTKQQVFLSTSSATGLMEAAARNGVQKKALALVNGAFSLRFAEIVESCGFECERMEVEWGGVFDPQTLRDRLKKGGIDAVTVVHSETSTGALNPIGEISKVVHEFDDVVILVDSVTGIGGAPALTDEWQLDFILTGSQKALALPPGLSFGTPSERLMQRSKTAKNKGVYFDLVTFAKNQKDFMTPTTPALSVMYSLDVQLERIKKETMEGRWARHAAMLKRCGEWVDSMREDRGVGISVLAPAGHRSPTVTTVKMPEGLPSAPVVAGMKEKGFVIGGGYGKIKDYTFRIGHMGDHTVAGQEAVLEALSEVLTK